MEFMKQVEQRTEAARAVPKTEFDIDFHLYRKTGWDFEMSISIEKHMKVSVAPHPARRG